MLNTYCNCDYTCSSSIISCWADVETSGPSGVGMPLNLVMTGFPRVAVYRLLCAARTHYLAKQYWTGVHVRSLSCWHIVTLSWMYNWLILLLFDLLIFNNKYMKLYSASSWVYLLHSSYQTQVNISLQQVWQLSLKPNPLSSSYSSYINFKYQTRSFRI